MRLTRLIAAATATAALLVPVVATSAEAKPVPITSSGAVRLAGADRYATAVKVSQKSFTTPQEYVVVASGENWPDALAAGPLAAHLGAPLLLVRKSGVPSVVAAELQRLRATHTIVIGGLQALPDHVMAAAGRWSHDTERLGGDDRYQTAEVIGSRIGFVRTVYVASGTTYADALAGGAAAAAEGGVLILTDPRRLTRVSGFLLSNYTPDDVVVLGGTAAISARTQREIATAAGPRARVHRMAGRDRYETAALVAGSVWGDTGAKAIFYASGTSFADALAGTPAAYVNAAPVLLTRSTCTPRATAAAEESLAPSLGVFLGGPTVTHSGSALC